MSLVNRAMEARPGRLPAASGAVQLGKDADAAIVAAIRWYYFFGVAIDVLGVAIDRPCWWTLLPFSPFYLLKQEPMMANQIHSLLAPDNWRMVFIDHQPQHSGA